MVSAIGSTGMARAIQLQGEGIARSPRSARIASATAGPAAVSSPAAELAAAGPPIDSDRVAALRTAIANGSYTVDPHAIAARMMALDLPGEA